MGSSWARPVEFRDEAGDANCVHLLQAVSSLARRAANGQDIGTQRGEGLEVLGPQATCKGNAHAPTVRDFNQVLELAVAAPGPEGSLAFVEGVHQEVGKPSADGVLEHFSRLGRTGDGIISIGNGNQRRARARNLEPFQPAVQRGLPSAVSSTARQAKFVERNARNRLPVPWSVFIVDLTQGGAQRDPVPEGVPCPWGAVRARRPRKEGHDLFSHVKGDSSQGAVPWLLQVQDRGAAIEGGSCLIHVSNAD